VNLSGLNLDASLFHIRYDNLITTNGAGTGPNDPLSLSRYIVIPDPSQPITAAVNASFLDKINGLIAVGRAQFDPSIIPLVKFIQDSANRNIGWQEFVGIDFDNRYDWDWGNFGSWNVGIAGYYELENRKQVDPTLPIDDAYKGKNSGGRLQRVRARLGWTDGTFSITGFANYRGHSAVVTDFVPPDCYWKTGFGPGSCYAGSPFFGPYTTFPSLSPSTYLFDLSLGYQTGDTPANAYLKNLSLQVAINNILNRAPPFRYGSRSRGRDIRAYDNNYSDVQRTVSVMLTKVW
jgi:hypothetical protein